MNLCNLEIAKSFDKIVKKSRVDYNGNVTEYTIKMVLIVETQHMFLTDV